jgi:hypothetical protein
MANVICANRRGVSPSLRSCLTAQASRTMKYDTSKNRAAVMLGRLGGLKGGKARAEKLTDLQRTNIARKAAKARWKRS